MWRAFCTPPLSNTKQYYLNQDSALEEKTRSGLDADNLLSAGQSYTFTVDFTDFMDYAFLTAQMGDSDQNGDSIHLYDAIDKHGMKWNGNNLYTILPIQAAMDHCHQRQMLRLEKQVLMRQQIKNTPCGPA